MLWFLNWDVDNLVSDPHDDVWQLLQWERFQADALQIHEQAQVVHNDPHPPFIFKLMILRYCLWNEFELNL